MPLQSPPPKLTPELLERTYLALIAGNEKPAMALYRGRVWTLREDGGYDSRPITDEDCE